MIPIVPKRRQKMLGYVSPVSTCASNTDDVLHVNYLLKSYTSKTQTRMGLVVIGSDSSHGPGGTMFVPWFHILAAFRGERGLRIHL